MTKVSIIIPCLNEEKYICTILSDLSTQGYPETEIIVVDGNSKDSTVSIVQRFPHVKLIQHSPHVATQRNLGASAASGDLLIFLDADTHIKDHFLAQLVSYHQKYNFDLAIPRYLPDDRSVVLLLFYNFFNLLFFLFQKIFPSGAGSAIFITSQAWKQSGPFNIQLTYDDIALIRKAARKSKFRVLPLNVFVSPRRIKKYGVIKMFIIYLLLSIFFCLNQFKLANKIRYEFGKF